MIESCLRNNKNEKEGDGLMAKEAITKFFDAAMTDRALAEKLAALATENGYDFTAEELLELDAARPISDGDVEDVSGGGAVYPGGRRPEKIIRSER